MMPMEFPDSFSLFSYIPLFLSGSYPFQSCIPQYINNIFYNDNIIDTRNNCKLFIIATKNVNSSRILIKFMILTYNYAVYTEPE